MNQIDIVCTSIKKMRDYDTKAEDFGFKAKTEATYTWVVKFEVTLGHRTVKPAMAYETEEEARRFSEGKTYTLLEWAQLAFE